MFDAQAVRLWEWGKGANIPSDIGESKRVCILCCPPIENGSGKGCALETLVTLPLTLRSPFRQPSGLAEVVSYLQLGCRET